MVTLLNMAVTNCPDAIIAAMRDELASRGVSQPQLWAVVACCHGIQEAKERFALVLGEALAQAKVRAHNESVLDGVALGD